MKRNCEFIDLGEFEMTSPVMRVSDPCYERDVWCCGTVDHCKLGTWEAGVLKTDEGEWGTRCAVLAVRHIAAHIDDDSFCRYIIQQDISEIAADLRETHREDFFSVPEDNPLKGLLEAATENASPDSDPEQASLAFICKRLRLNFKKLSGEEKKWLKKISEKSDLLKNPNPQRGRK